MVRFEKLKNWHTQESKLVLQGGLDPSFVRPHVFLSASGGRTGSIWNTAHPLGKENTFPYVTTFGPVQNGWSHGQGSTGRVI